MALKNCKECGQQVSTKAMSCPHCGAVLRRKTGCFTWFVAIIFLLIMIGYCSSRYSYKTSDSINKSELKNIVDNYSKSSSIIENPIDKIKPEMVSLATLLDQYKNNEVRADGLYKDKIIQTTGIVEMVKKDIINDTYVILRTDRGLEIPMVQCYFDKQFISQVSQLNPGDNITIKGHLKGLMLNVLVDKCTLVQADSEKYKLTVDSVQVSPIAVPAQGESKPGNEATQLKLKELENGEYFIANFGKKVKFKNKHFMGHDKVDNCNLGAGIEKVEFGDLNNDGLKDAVMTLQSSACGSSHYFTDIAIVLNRNGKPFYAGNIEDIDNDIGQNTSIDFLSIKNGMIIVKTTAFGPNDPMCCPSLEKILKYKLSGDKVIKIK